MREREGGREGGWKGEGEIGCGCAPDSKNQNSTLPNLPDEIIAKFYQHTIRKASILQHTATHCNTLQHAATHQHKIRRALRFELRV